MFDTSKESEFIRVQVEDVGGHIRLSSEEHEAEWSFKKNNGLVSERCVEFFESVGFDGAETGQLQAKVTTTEPDTESQYIKSNTGKWYLAVHRCEALVVKEQAHHNTRAE